MTSPVSPGRESLLSPADRVTQPQFSHPVENGVVGRTIGMWHEETDLSEDRECVHVQVDTQMLQRKPVKSRVLDRGQTMFF